MAVGGAADPELEALQRRGTRLGIGVLAGVVLLLILSVVLVGGVVIVKLMNEVPGELPIERNEQELKLTRARLVSVKSELEAIPSPVGASHAQSTDTLDCHEDSGAVLQPWVGRSWTVQPADADRIIAAVAETLGERGWVGSSVTGNIVERRLMRSWGEWSGEVSIGRE